MREEVQRWWKIAADDAEKAQILFKNKKYDGAIFYCQQAVEKGLKALLLRQQERIPKIHDLVRLGKEVSLPEALLNYCKELTSGYIYSRYPDVDEEPNLDQVSKDFLNFAQEILLWIEKKL